MIIDGDQHLYETRNLWRDYSPQSKRDKALHIQDDDLGYSWLTLDSKKISAIWTNDAGDFGHLGELRAGSRNGVRNPDRNYDDIDSLLTDPVVRRDQLTAWGIDQAVVFPQWTFIAEYQMADLETAQLNMAAYNRWAVEIGQVGQGVLHPVGYLTLNGDGVWLREQIEFLARGDVHLVIFAPGLINGKRMSHPDNDWIWALFVEHAITPAWHVTTQMASVLQDWTAWWDNDLESHFKAVTGLFQGIAPQLALADLIVNGVFDRYPTLSVICSEVGTHWLTIGRRLDRSLLNLKQLVGKDYNQSLRYLPSEYLRQHLRVICVIPDEVTRDWVDLYPEVLSFGGDYPHPEGLGNPLDDYRRAFADRLEEDRIESVPAGFWGANLQPALSPL